MDIDEGATAEDNEVCDDAPAPKLSQAQWCGVDRATSRTAQPHTAGFGTRHDSRGTHCHHLRQHERDRVILAPPTELNIGDAVLAEIAPGHYVLHRIIQLEGDQVTLMGDGNVQGTESCRRQDVAGIVTHYLRPKRTLLASDPQLQRRIRLWRRLLPIRRYLLFINKAII